MNFSKNLSEKRIKIETFRKRTRKTEKNLTNFQTNLNVEKYRATQCCLRTVIVTKKKLNDSQQINDALCNFYQTLFKEKLSLSRECIQSFLDKVSVPKLNP